MNVKQSAPFLCVSDMERSIHYYVDGLGFFIQNEWVVDGKRRWCWLSLGGAALMLQEFDHKPVVNPGQGVAIYFICEDASSIYREITFRGIEASEPQVGNAMWVTSLTDPDGYQLHFESSTNVPEETRLSGLSRSQQGGG